jgi:general secretion pathway protein I
MRPPRASRGFTLLEVLVAFIVMAAAVGILYRTFSTGLQGVDMISGYGEAIALAEAKLGAVGLEKPLQEGEDSGTTDDRRFSWTLVIAPYTPPGSEGDKPGGFISPNQLLRASVTVTWDERGQQKRSVQLSTVRLAVKYPA